MNKNKIPGLFYNNGVQVCEGDIIKNIYREFFNDIPRDMREGDDDDFLRFTDDYKGTFDIYIVKYDSKYASYIFYSLNQHYKDDNGYIKNILNLNKIQCPTEDDLTFVLDYKSKSYSYESLKISNIYDDDGFDLLKEFQKVYYPNFIGDLKVF